MLIVLTRLVPSAVEISKLSRSGGKATRMVRMRPRTSGWLGNVFGEKINSGTFPDPNSFFVSATSLFETLLLLKAKAAEVKKTTTAAIRTLHAVDRLTTEPKVEVIMTKIQFVAKKPFF